MTIAIASAEASAPIRWSCSVCDDEGVISNWADSPYDLRRRGLSLADALEEVIVSDKTAAVLRDLMLLDPNCERLVYGMRAHPNGAALLTNADELEELIGFVAAEDQLADLRVLLRDDVRRVTGRGHELAGQA